MPKILWITPSCQLDTTSGAALAARTTLRMLAKAGYEAMFAGVTVFDHSSGGDALKELADYTQMPAGSVFEVVVDGLRHRLVATATSEKSRLETPVEQALLATFHDILATFRPDAIMYYGQISLMQEMAAQARAAGIATIFLLCNGSYTGKDWAQHADLIITEGEATADLYADRLACRPTPVGCFIDPATVVAETHARQNVLFVNPARYKGVNIVVALALLLESRRPDIVFEVVCSRGNDWQRELERLSTAWGSPRSSLGNVILTPNTADMRPIYGRARLLLAPSLWWEAWGRVVTESCFNGVPAVVTARGGLPEAMQTGGIHVELPDVCHQSPYDLLPPRPLIEAIAQFIERCHDDAPFYSHLSERARRSAFQRHHPDISTRRLLAALQPLMERRTENNH